MSSKADEARDPKAQAEELLERARWLVAQPEFGAPTTDDPSQTMTMKGFAPGFAGFDATRPGDRILMATSRNDAHDVSEALVAALQERGAKVDHIVVDNGPDRLLREDDEIAAQIMRSPWTEGAKSVLRPQYDIPWVTELFVSGGYDMLIQGHAMPFLPCRWEGHPWTSAEMFLSESVVFPRDLQMLINRKVWGPIWEEGRGARVRVRDPEGTDFSWTLLPSFWESQLMFTEEPCWCHLMLHPIPPLSADSDAEGVVAGTTAHYTKPFPQIQLHLERGRVERIEGGGAYGDGLRALDEETRDVQYLGFPRPGLLWFWEAALATNPKVARPSDPTMISSGGSAWERWRAGALHFGFGTCGPSDQELWAAERGHPYGHVHVHQFFSTIELTTPSGQTIVSSDHGRLTAMDDPEVRECAARHGDPDEVLAAAWTPPIPGVSIPGELEVYLREPARWFAHRADT